MNVSTMEDGVFAGDKPAVKPIIKGGRKAVFVAAANAIIPRGGAFETGALDYDLVPRVNEFLGKIEPMVRFSVPFILLYVEFGAVFYTGRRFTRLSQDRATRFLDGMERSRFAYRRYILLFLKMLTMMTFYEHRVPAEAIGYYHGCHLGGDQGGGAVLETTGREAGADATKKAENKTGEDP